MFEGAIRAYGAERDQKHIEERTMKLKGRRNPLVSCGVERAA